MKGKTANVMGGGGNKGMLDSHQTSIGPGRGLGSGEKDGRVENLVA